MGRSREEIQVLSDGRCRIALYHLARANGKYPYVYIGRDVRRARRIGPLIRSAVADAITPGEAKERAEYILSASSEVEERERLKMLLNQGAVRPAYTREEAIRVSRQELVEIGIDEASSRGGLCAEANAHVHTSARPDRRSGHQTHRTACADIPTLLY